LALQSPNLFGMSPQQMLAGVPQTSPKFFALNQMGTHAPSPPLFLPAPQGQTSLIQGRPQGFSLFNITPTPTIVPSEYAVQTMAPTVLTTTPATSTTAAAAAGVNPQLQQKAFFCFPPVVPPLAANPAQHFYHPYFIAPPFPSPNLVPDRNSSVPAPPLPAQMPAVQDSTPPSPPSSASQFVPSFILHTSVIMYTCIYYICVCIVDT